MFNKNNTQLLTLAEVWRPLSQFFVMLAGPSGREWLNAFKRFLRKEHPWISTRWKIWTVARMGMGIPLFKLMDTIKSRGYHIRYSDTSPEIDFFSLEKPIEFNKVDENVYFTLASPKELGLKPGWTRRELLDASLKNGLAHCLSGDIIEILAQRKERLDPNDERLHCLCVAMEPIKIEEHLSMFCIGVYKKGTYYSLGYHNGILTSKLYFPDNVNDKYIFRIVDRS